MRWTEPHTLSALHACLQQGYTVIGGGTALLRDFASPPALCGMTGILEYRELGVTESVMKVGTAVTLEQWLQDERTPRIVRSVLQQMGTATYRRLATVLGTAMNQQPVSDLYPILRLLDTRICYLSPDDPAPVLRETLLHWHAIPETSAVLTALVPRYQENTEHFFRKYRKTRGTRPLFNLAASLETLTSLTVTARVVVSGFGPDPYEWTVQARPDEIFDRVANRLNALLDNSGANPFFIHILGKFWEEIWRQHQDA
jgi:CO/xanthine dehydrogenase FAD-binding subunit